MPLDIENFNHKQFPGVVFSSFIAMYNACNGRTVDDEFGSLYNVTYIKQQPDREE